MYHRRIQVQLQQYPTDPCLFLDYGSNEYYIDDDVFNDEDEVPPRFENLFVARLFVVNWQMRHIYPEEQFIGPLDERVSRRLINRGWQRLAEHPVRVNLDVVREFYANSSTRPDDGYAVVRGVPFYYNYAFLHDYLCLPGDPYVEDEYIDEHRALVYATRRIAPGANWILNDQRNELAVPYSHMTGESVFWRRFVQFRLLPPRLSYTVSSDQLLLISNIMTNINIDVAYLIHVEMRRVAMTAREVGLPYGSIITAIAEQAGVPVYTSDEIINPH